MDILEELRNNKIPVVSIDDSGSVHLGEMSDELLAIADEIINPPDYREKRRREYPAIEEQLDMMFHDLENETDEWRIEIRRIKDKYPKQ